jgi:hypothetical protein
LLVGDVSGHRNQIARGDHGIFSPVAALAVDDRYPLAAGKILGPRAESIHDANSLKADRRRELRLNPCIQPAHIKQIGRVDRCSQDANPHFFLPWFWNGALLNLKNLGGLTVLTESYRFHDFRNSFLIDESRVRSLCGRRSGALIS